MKKCFIFLFYLLFTVFMVSCSSKNSNSTNQALKQLPMDAAGSKDEVLKDHTSDDIKHMGGTQPPPTTTTSPSDDLFLSPAVSYPIVTKFAFKSGDILQLESYDLNVNPKIFTFRAGNADDGFKRLKLFLTDGKYDETNASLDGFPFLFGLFFDDANERRQIAIGDAKKSRDSIYSIDAKEEWRIYKDDHSDTGFVYISMQD